jgi:hypothetical protein
MNKNTYIIWKSQDDRNVRDVNDVIGLFYGTYEEADQIIEKLNAADPSVKEGLFGSKRYGYWRSEPPVITAKNLHEFTEGL